jgi:hypothetical protein
MTVAIDELRSRYAEAIAFLSAAKAEQAHAESESRRNPCLRTHALYVAAEESLTAAYAEVGRARAKIQNAECRAIIERTYELGER